MEGRFQPTSDQPLQARAPSKQKECILPIPENKVTNSAKALLTRLWPFHQINKRNNDNKDYNAKE